jgi:hypothetical protein
MNLERWKNSSIAVCCVNNREKNLQWKHVWIVDHSFINLVWNKREKVVFATDAENADICGKKVRRTLRNHRKHKKQINKSSLESAYKKKKKGKNIKRKWVNFKTDILTILYRIRSDFLLKINYYFSIVNSLRLLSHQSQDQ